MNIFPADRAVNFVQAIGVDDTFTVSSATLENEVGTTFPVTVVPKGAGAVRVTCDASANALLTGTRRGLRQVVMSINSPSHPAGQRVEITYILTEASGVDLAIQENSFQSYSQALLLASSMSNLGNFTAGSRDERLASLRDAWVSLSSLSYDYGDQSDNQSRAHDVPWASVSDLTDLSAAEFELLDVRFKTALRRAQIVEADSRMSLSTVESYRADGILSSKIGETAQTFRDAAPLAMSVSRRAMLELRGYLNYNVRTGRAG